MPDCCLCLLLITELWTGASNDCDIPASFDFAIAKTHWSKTSVLPSVSEAQ